MEVAKLKNAFRYGIESYTGTQTAMSSITDNIKLPEDEPLWAVDESSLSEVVELLTEKDLTKTTNTVIDSSVPNKLKITGTAIWQNNLFNSITDNQIFLYFTTINSNIKINDTLDISNISNTEPQNIMVCINRNENNSFIYIIMISMHIMLIMRQEHVTYILTYPSQFN